MRNSKGQYTRGNRKIDLTGLSFGRLVVIDEHKRKRANGSVCWNCKCRCGNKIIAGSGHLREGSVKSCGCLRRETVGLSRRIFKPEAYNLSAKKRHSKYLSDYYIKTLISNAYGITHDKITPEMIDLKRAGVAMYRTLKQFKKWRSENEHTDHRNV